jgi:hypothetical protein
LGSNSHTSEFERMARRKIEEMARAGKSRAEIERFLGRHRLGDRYAGLLDGLFGDRLSGGPNARRPGAFRRLWRRR